jgi:hypothetical protein
MDSNSECYTATSEPYRTVDSTFYVLRAPPNFIYFQLCTPEDVGV